ncbi:hypothetical protein [Cytobacillus praedii]|uniref:Uncharacterized protein n=1 Tax=Cytobacillus praedii TaxID=1742358 RepID=A0A4R1ANR2_9BACI|nr:hypothetical protein [Cytobacillus praedii]TCJ00954.1 hypothetical protein E0Y62_26350 [Cytobacillus praedii]
MILSNEFYLNKNESLNYLGKTLETYYTLNSFDGIHLTIKLKSMEDLLEIPFDNPKEFATFLSKHWTEQDMKNFYSEEKYLIDGKYYRTRGE